MAPKDGISPLTGQPETGAEKKKRENEHEAWRRVIADHVHGMVEAIMLRSGCEARVFNRMGLELCEKLPGFRDQLLSLGWMQLERHAAVSELAQMLDNTVFTTENTLKLLYDEKDPLSTRQISKLRAAYTYVELADGEPGRVMWSQAPVCNSRHDPDTPSEDHYSAAGIPTKDTLMPFIFKTPAAAKEMADAMNEGEEFFMPEWTKPEIDEAGKAVPGTSEYALEGCARPALDLLGRVLDLAEQDDNLLPLKRGRTFNEDSDDEGYINELTKRHRGQYMSDAFRWGSSHAGKEANRIIVKSMDLKQLQGNPRYTQDQAFGFVGDDAESQRQLSQLGGEKGLAGTMAAGVMVEQLSAEDVPEHVRGTVFEPFARTLVEVDLDVPRTNSKDGCTHQPLRMHSGGDASAAAAQSNVSGPTDKHWACDLYLCAKGEQGDWAKCEKAIERTYSQTLGQQRVLSLGCPALPHIHAHAHFHKPPLAVFLTCLWSE